MRGKLKEWIELTEMTKHKWQEKICKNYRNKKQR